MNNTNNVTDLADLKAALLELRGAYLWDWERRSEWTQASNGKALRDTFLAAERAGLLTSNDGVAKPFVPEERTCPKCAAKGVAFNCNQRGCPVNGGAAYE